jgi:Spy/CpxP family protein refolding chaperone
MNKNKLIIIIVGLLILLNVTTLAFIAFNQNNRKGPPPPHPQGQPGDRPDPFIKEMGFTEQQLVNFEAVKEKHMRRNEEINREIRLKYSAYYGQLKTTQTDQSEALAALDTILLLHKKLAVSNYEHFEEIKKLCTEEQLSKFNTLIEEVGKQFSADNKPPPPKGKERR